MLWSDLFIWSSWTLLTVVWLLNRNLSKPTRHRYDSPVQRASYSVPAFLGACLVLSGHRSAPFRLTFCKTWESWTVAAWLGPTLVLGGLMVALWARQSLGNNWSARIVFKIDHQLVTRGPYAVVRHPIYSGLLLMVAGTAIAAGSPVSLLGMLLVMLGAWVKLRYEETLMLRAFGESYRAYQGRVKGLIPFVW